MPPPYDDDFYFFRSLRSHVKFSIIVVFFLVLLLILLWNWQPWFEVEIKPADKTSGSTTEGTNGQAGARRDFDTKLQSAVVYHAVRPGDTLSEIAERNGIEMSVLMKHNGIDNPNSLRAGQQLKIPR
jgi:hypothetical protein